jgi:hypothetical protein
MQKGVIFYVTLGREEVMMLGQPDLMKIVQSLDAGTVYVATSEAEVVHGWSYLIAGGMDRVSCVTAAYDPALGKFEIHEIPLRMWAGNTSTPFSPDGVRHDVEGIQAGRAEPSEW